MACRSGSSPSGSAPRSGRAALLALGGYAFAWCAGFLVVFASAGIGIRAMKHGKEEERCGLCHEPIANRHEYREIDPGAEVMGLICPSFAEFVLDGSHAVTAEDAEGSKITRISRRGRHERS